MDADWSVELGHDDPSLEFPWASPDGTQRFVDLSRHLEAICEIPEAAQYPELARFLLELNGKFSPWLTAKCDVWIDNELGEAEDIYDAKLKMCSYIDLVRRNESERFSFEQHEQWVKSTAMTLRNIGPHPIGCELIVRRCWYPTGSRADDDPVPGFYITLYVSGYGDNEAEALARWAGGLTRVSSIVLGV
ncbi:MAG TPA: hypothetical protein VFC15_10540 [Candidatus Limnocylindrales bacterium]|jgi:hypothetical protein|nr:hypothetical protein [Candidatus Limnocylindrales bacterium]